MPAILLSGYATPIDNIPAWLRYVDWINPMRHFIVIVKGLFLKDFSRVALLHSLYPLLVIAIGTLGAASWLLRRRLA